METKQFETKQLTFREYDNFFVSTNGYVKMYSEDLYGTRMSPDELEAVSDALRWAAGKMRQNASNANCGDCGKETE